MSNEEEKVLNNILDKIDYFTKCVGNNSYENSLKSAQIVKDMSEAYLNITKARE